MTTRYRVTRKYEFSPILLSNGCKVSLEIHETASSYKIIYDHGRFHNKTTKIKQIPYSNNERNTLSFRGCVIDNQMQSSINGKQEENLVLKRRHYFDNSKSKKDISDLNRYSLRRYTPNSCWELQTKPFSVQELSDKFETISESYSPLMYKSVSKLIDRKLTFLISTEKQRRILKTNSNNFKSQRSIYPFRNKPLGLNVYESNISNSQNVFQKSKKTFNFRSPSFYGSTPVFSSNIYIPLENQIKIKNVQKSDIQFSSKFINKIPRFCFSSINLSGKDHNNNIKLLEKNTNCFNNYGSNKSIESLFCSSQLIETEDLNKDRKIDNKKKSLVQKEITPLISTDQETSGELTENIKNVKSQLKSIKEPDLFSYNKFQKMNKTPSNKFDKKIKFFENLSNNQAILFHEKLKMNENFNYKFGSFSKYEAN